jgi:hypothetical protein
MPEAEAHHEHHKTEEYGRDEDHKTNFPIVKLRMRFANRKLCKHASHNGTGDQTENPYAPKIESAHGLACPE